MVFSFFSLVGESIEKAFSAMLLPMLAFFGYTQLTVVVPPVPVHIVPAPAASSSPVVFVSATTMPTRPKPAPKPVVTAPPVVVVPIPPPPPQPTPSATSSDTQSYTIGTTTIVVKSVPLLWGGSVKAGGLVPISYLQINNVGTEGAILKGFWVKQNGSAPAPVVIGLATVDDQGGSRGMAGGVEGSSFFQNGTAFAPTDAYFAPGQMRLFTIKAQLSQSVSASVGTQLMIDVVSIETTAGVQGSFPIHGTTWTISQ